MAITPTRSIRFKAVVAVILLALTMIVAFQNTAVVHTTVLFGAFTMPLALLLLLTFFSGSVVGGVLLRRWSVRKGALNDRA